MTKPVRVLVVEGQRMIREGLVALLDAEEGIEVVGQVGTVEEAVHQCESEAPDVILVALDAGDAEERIRVVSRSCPGARFVGMTGNAGDDQVLRGLAPGIALFARTSPWEALVRTVVKVASGPPVPAPTDDPALSGSPPARRRGPGRQRPEPRLTPREQQILQILAEGKSAAEVAEALSVSPLTVQGHVKRILAKLGAQSRTQALAIALRTGLVSIPPKEAPRHPDGAGSTGDPQAD